MSFSINAASAATPVAPVAPAQSSTAGATTTSGLANDPLANESTFLKLLVSQLQNQNPLNPTDANQFVGQLTAYSQLEQLIGIRENTAAAPPADTSGQNSDGSQTTSITGN